MAMLPLLVIAAHVGGATPKYCFDFMDDDPQSVDCLVQYLYRQDYQNPCGGREGDQERGKNIKNPDEIKLPDDNSTHWQKSTLLGLKWANKINSSRVDLVISY
ncbi:hypothetical protein IWW34DRAFT_292661 [Fusarium oxysporum f. sp. albedinis]|nr:hypothetical protein IWW34DRAFT_292661 [Fusarium oxysporum f. sp. albedinis]